MPVPAKVRITPTACPYCGWTCVERPRHAWLALVDHHVTCHPGEPRPDAPDELASLRGDWEYAVVTYRKSRDVSDYVREVNAFVALSNYLDAHGLIHTAANPQHDWYVAMRAFSLRLVWETAVVTQSGDGTDADAAFVALVEHLDAHGLTGKECDPRHRTE